MRAAIDSQIRTESIRPAWHAHGMFTIAVILAYLGLSGLAAWYWSRLQADVRRIEGISELDHEYGRDEVSV